MKADIVESERDRLARDLIELQTFLNATARKRDELAVEVHTLETTLKRQRQERDTKEYKHDGAERTAAKA